MSKYIDVQATRDRGEDDDGSTTDGDMSEAREDEYEKGSFIASEEDDDDEDDEDASSVDEMEARVAAERAMRKREREAEPKQQGKGGKRVRIASPSSDVAIAAAPTRAPAPAPAAPVPAVPRSAPVDAAAAVSAAKAKAAAAPPTWAPTQPLPPMPPRVVSKPPPAAAAAPTPVLPTPALPTAAPCTAAAASKQAAAAQQAKPVAPAPKPVAPAPKPVAPVPVPPPAAHPPPPAAAAAPEKPRQPRESQESQEDDEASASESEAADVPPPAAAKRPTLAPRKNGMQAVLPKPQGVKPVALVAKPQAARRATSTRVRFRLEITNGDSLLKWVEPAAAVMNDLLFLVMVEPRFSGLLLSSMALSETMALKSRFGCIVHLGVHDDGAEVTEEDLNGTAMAVNSKLFTMLLQHAVIKGAPVYLTVYGDAQDVLTIEAATDGDAEDTDFACPLLADDGSFQERIAQINNVPINTNFSFQIEMPKLRQLVNGAPKMGARYMGVQLARALQGDVTHWRVRFRINGDQTGNRNFFVSHRATRSAKAGGDGHAAGEALSEWTTEPPPTREQRDSMTFEDVFSIEVAHKSLHDFLTKCGSDIAWLRLDTEPTAHGSAPTPLVIVTSQGADSAQTSHMLVVGGRAPGGADDGNGEE